MLDPGRRQFIMLLGGAAAWPVAARAQQAPLPLIGFLSSRSREESDSAVSAFLRGLNEAGYAENRDVTILYRWADGLYDRLPALAADLIEHRVAAIASGGGPVTALAAKAATSAVPITFVIADDPVKHGLVASLNAPRGNLTGITILAAGLNAKRLELLKEFVPSAKVVAFLVNPSNPETADQTHDALVAASALSQQLIVVQASNASNLESAFGHLLERNVSAVLISADPFFLSRRDQVVALAARRRLPASYPLREFVSAGGLMSYGTSATEAYRWAGIYQAGF